MLDLGMLRTDKIPVLFLRLDLLARFLKLDLGLNRSLILLFLSSRCGLSSQFGIKVNSSSSQAKDGRETDDFTSAIRWRLRILASIIVGVANPLTLRCGDRLASVRPDSSSPESSSRNVHDGHRHLKMKNPSQCN
jgi:hypothetical protein